MKKDHVRKDEWEKKESKEKWNSHISISSENTTKKRKSKTEGGNTNKSSSRSNSSNTNRNNNYNNYNINNRHNTNGIVNDTNSDYDEPLLFDFLTKENYEQYNNFVNFCEINFSGIDLKDVNDTVDHLRRGNNVYLSNYVSSSSEEEEETGAAVGVEAGAEAGVEAGAEAGVEVGAEAGVEVGAEAWVDASSRVRRKKGAYRKNLKLINIKRSKRARVNMIIIKKKFYNRRRDSSNDDEGKAEGGKTNTVIISPFFMPVGTKCCIKGLIAEEVENICNYIILSNTYHLSNIYDMSIFKNNKDINNFIRFPNAILTDSGGFQMVSLSKRIKILEEGILFNNIYDSSIIRKNISVDTGKSTNVDIHIDSHIDNHVDDHIDDHIDDHVNTNVDSIYPGGDASDRGTSKKKMPGKEQPKYRGKTANKDGHITEIMEEQKNKGSKSAKEKYLNIGEDILLSPELSIKLQNHIGSDIIMALDDVRSATEMDINKIEEATCRTNRWLKRCIDSHKRKEEQTLFGIIQGGLHMSLRNKSMEFIIKQKLNGYAVGGLCGGEKKKKFIEIINHCSNEKNKKYNYLPVNKCRYIMGIGYIIDILFCSLFGYDMYDCVYPSRTARFNTALSFDGTIKLKLSKYKYDFTPIVKHCSCYVCKNYTKSSIHLLISKKNPIVNILLTIHNLYFTLHFCYLMRVSIFVDKIDQFVTTVLYNNFVIGYKNGNYKIPDNDKVDLTCKMASCATHAKQKPVHSNPIVDPIPVNDSNASFAHITSVVLPYQGEAKHMEVDEEAGEVKSKQTANNNTADIPSGICEEEMVNIRWDGEINVRRHSTILQDSSTSRMLGMCRKEKMINELKEHLPYWALEALQHADIELKF
ncbi:queuine tRNA-ribosyltransferase, putative [Plasmodium malariae]|uniref:Queuine tRNA-ribosyltransferase, putative n=1 Tax=Plasmodium malariae TaxID=5858 RepID=A0A1C3KA46_PLAMA|nr:queuine tRNA-ribosyltransferase, putative [Plasmodium malariae]